MSKLLAHRRLRSSHATTHERTTLPTLTPTCVGRDVNATVHPLERRCVSVRDDAIIIPNAQCPILSRRGGRAKYLFLPKNVTFSIFLPNPAFVFSLVCDPFSFCHSGFACAECVPRVCVDLGPPILITYSPFSLKLRHIFLRPAFFDFL